MENDNIIEFYRNSFKPKNIEEYYQDVKQVEEEYNNTLKYIFNISNISDLTFDIIKNFKIKSGGMSFEDIFNHFCILNGKISNYTNLNDMEFCFSKNFGFSHIIHENGVITSISRSYINHSKIEILSWLHARNNDEKLLFEKFYKEGKIY